MCIIKILKTGEILAYSLWSEREKSAPSERRSSALGGIVLEKGSSMGCQGRKSDIGAHFAALSCSSCNFHNFHISTWTGSERSCAPAQKYLTDAARRVRFRSAKLAQSGDLCRPSIFWPVFVTRALHQRSCGVVSCFVNLPNLKGHSKRRKIVRESAACARGSRVTSDSVAVAVTVTFQLSYLSLTHHGQAETRTYLRSKLWTPFMFYVLFS